MMRRSFLTGALALGMMPPMAVTGVTALQDPGAFIAGLGAQGLQALAPQFSEAQRLARFRELFQAYFDVFGIGQFAIGRHWYSLAPWQQQEYLRLFQEYTVRAYSARLAEYGGTPLRVTGSRRGIGEVVVSSEIIRPDGRPARLDWHVCERGDGYRITDVYVNGISMKITQRDYFLRIIQNNGGRADALLAVLRQELGLSR